jgi:hypothetical protein
MLNKCDFEITGQCCQPYAEYFLAVAASSKQKKSSQPQNAGVITDLMSPLWTFNNKP